LNMKSRDGDGVAFRRWHNSEIAKKFEDKNRERYAVRGTREVELKGALGVAAVVEL
jgi:hypothetical protein